VYPVDFTEAEGSGRAKQVDTTKNIQRVREPILRRNGLNGFSFAGKKNHLIRAT
jgi:hypothetical protein